MGGQVEIQWGIDYRDGCGIRSAPDEWTARKWASHWNNHRVNKLNPITTIHRRTVTTSGWSDSEDLDHTTTITMDCLICDDQIKTSDVQQAIRFNREHQALHHPTTPTPAPVRDDAGGLG